jgi:transposase
MEKLKIQLKILKENKLKPNYAELAREYDCDYRTVKKYNEGYEGKTNTRNKLSCYDQYKELIKTKLSLKGANMKAVHEYLKDEFNDINSYSNFRKFVIKEDLLKNKGGNKFVRYETKEAKQAQVDWKEDITLRTINGEFITFNVFTYRLSYSRLVYYEFRLTKTREDVFECLINAFTNTGGVPKEILFDNMRSIVDIDGKTRKVNAKVIQFAKDFGFKVRLCRPYKAQTKGKVESANKFINWLIPYNNELNSEDDIICKLKELTIKVNSSINETTKVTPYFLFQKEKEYLLPIPNRSIVESYKKQIYKYKVHKDSLINYKGKKYSVPCKYINQFVTTKQIENNLHIYYNTELIVIHEINNKNINYKDEHYKQLLSFSIKDNNKIEEITKENLNIYDQLLEVK